MKRPLKLLLSLCILIVGIYATSPWWIPQILTSQLPPGLQLVKLQVSYPGFSGIDIKMVRIKGNFLSTDLGLSATDIRISYRGWKTEIGSLSLDVFLQDVETTAAIAFTLDDLSLPITKFTVMPPELSVDEMKVVLHHNTNFEPGNIMAGEPLVLDFQAVKLLLQTNNNFHLTTIISSAGEPEFNGQLNLDISTNSRKAEIRFPAGVNSPAWLTVSLEQTDQALITTTQLQVAFDAGLANQKWLSSELARVTGGRLTHVRGKFEIKADFSGEETQAIKRLSFDSEQLQAEIDGGTLVLETKLLAEREGEKVTVTPRGVSDIQYLDKTGKISNLIMSAVPGLQRIPQPLAMVHASVEHSSTFVFQAGPVPSMVFSGDVNLELSSAESDGSVVIAGLQIEIDDFPRLDTMAAQGLITLDWTETAAFSYTSEDLELKADRLSLSSTGNFRVHGSNVTYTQAGKSQFLHPVIILPGDKHSPITTVTVDELIIEAELTSVAGEITSTGSGTFLLGHVTPPVISVDRVDLTWQEFDLLKPAGKLSTKTQGFSTEIDGEIWTGFDFDMTYALESNADFDGSGMLKFDSDIDIPFEFTGNAQAEQWNITLPPSTIKLAQLGTLLPVAHFELPASVKLTDGFIDFQGDIFVDDEITAKMSVKGYEIGASMLESSASKAGFSFKTSYGSTGSAIGPVFIETVVLAGGIDVQHIKANVNLENAESFALTNLHAEVFDGWLNLENLILSESSIENTTAELSHISLGQLLAYADIDGLEGSGLLDISLPLGSDQTGIYIQNGTFSSTVAGYLAYTKDGMAGSNIGLQALENFQYQDLSGTLDYQSDGAYKITIHLEGNNPDLYAGHPIVFNLNITGSLPELFETLFITGDFEESILKQIGIN